MSNFSVSGRNAIVTGASKGIGHCIAEELAESGANVSICSRSQERIDSVAESIKADGGTAFAYECNVRSTEALEEYIDATVEEFGGLDLMVANAGGAFIAPFEEISENGWKSVVDLNLHSTRHSAYLASEYMRQHSGGDIITFASVNGLHAAPGESHYSASKAAIVRLTETLAVEFAQYGIRVNCVAPGAIHTEGTKERLGIDESDLPPREEVDRRIGHPEDIADVVLFLASPAAAFVNGQTITPRGVPQRGNDIAGDVGLKN
jgi:NAD(P)-dependent dehydrogenase (short-subunit alcohol dehydrogenase family)